MSTRWSTEAFSHEVVPAQFPYIRDCWEVCNLFVDFWVIEEFRECEPVVAFFPEWSKEVFDCGVRVI